MEEQEREPVLCSRSKSESWRRDILASTLWLSQNPAGAKQFLFYPSSLCSVSTKHHSHIPTRPLWSSARWLQSLHDCGFNTAFYLLSHSTVFYYLWQILSVTFTNTEKLCYGDICSFLAWKVAIRDSLSLRSGSGGGRTVQEIRTSCLLLEQCNGCTCLHTLSAC